MSVTGLTSNPTIFDYALKHGTAYDVAIYEAMPLDINVPPAKNPADK
jgi:transaldolase